MTREGDYNARRNHEILKAQQARIRQRHANDAAADLGWDMRHHYNEPSWKRRRDQLQNGNNVQRNYHTNDSGGDVVVGILALGVTAAVAATLAGGERAAAQPTIQQSIKDRPGVVSTTNIPEKPATLLVDLAPKKVTPRVGR